jgi:hypothetical protein
MKRNVLCRIYPRRDGEWRRTVNHLLARWSQFTGRKIVAIDADEYCEESWQVSQAFGHDANMEIDWIERDCEPDTDTIEVKNISGVPHFTSFQTMLQRVREDSSITFYCHSPGAHEEGEIGSRKWCDVMATVCLDYPALVDEAFQNGASLAGAFRPHKGHPGHHSRQFVGTWLWSRDERMGNLSWNCWTPNTAGVEGWQAILPGTASACLFFDDADPVRLRDNDYWESVVVPALYSWHRSSKTHGLIPVASTPRHVSDRR